MMLKDRLHQSIETLGRDVLMMVYEQIHLLQQIREKATQQETGMELNRILEMTRSSNSNCSDIPQPHAGGSFRANVPALFFPEYRIDTFFFKEDLLHCWIALGIRQLARTNSALRIAHPLPGDLTIRGCLDIYLTIIEKGMNVE